MSTHSGYTPPAVPECAYAPRMTRAAALALQGAAGLLENCVVVITDGPTIGTVGNTSVTEIELNPVSATEFGQSARVHTTFAPEAWSGIYDLANNSITELRDDFGNVAKDIDVNAPTVQTQWPWHLGGPLFRDNYAEDSTFPGLDTAVGFLINNRFVGSAINFTGKIAGNVTDSSFLNAGVVGGAGGGSFAMARSQITGSGPGTVIINHTGTGAFSYTEAIHRDGWITALSGGGNLSVGDSTLQNHGSATADLLQGGASAMSVNDSVLTSPGTANAVLSNLGTGTVTVFRTTLNGAVVSKAAGSTGPLSFNGTNVVEATITVGPANGATTNSFTNGDHLGSIFQLLGPVAGGGRNDFTAGARINGALITVAATATAGVNFQGGQIDGGTITQNQSAGTSSMALFACHLQGFATITNNCVADPGAAGVILSRLTMVDSTMTIAGVSGKTGAAVVAQQVDMLGSTLTIPASVGATANDFHDKVRLHAASVNTAGFHMQNVIIEGLPGAKTLTAANFNRLANMSFDNTI